MNNVYIIAEAGVNHNGNLKLALKLCQEACKAGADAVKFQTFITEKNVLPSTSMADYQLINTGKTISQFDMLKELELEFREFEKIKHHCDELGITFLSTPDDEESLDFLLSLGVETIKIGSGEITNIPFLKKIGSRNIDIILSTGMSYLGEVERAYNNLISSGAKSVALLHCTTNYPCLVEEVNLKAMITLKEAFKTKVGYSDHTTGIEISIAAAAMGAEIIEKHFTLDKNMEGPDHKASIDPSELKQMVTSIRNIEKATGNGIKKPNKSEEIMKKFVRRVITSSVNIDTNDKIMIDRINFKKANYGIPAEYYDLLLGKKVKRWIPLNTPLQWEDINM